MVVAFSVFLDAFILASNGQFRALVTCDDTRSADGIALCRVAGRVYLIARATHSPTVGNRPKMLNILCQISLREDFG